MDYRFHTLDVFTSERFGGNPLAVVHDADALSSADMQLIAREFGLSETVFVLKPTLPAHTAKVRIFTPASELPFAGHPTVGTAVLIAEQAAVRNGMGDKDLDSIVVLEETIGTVRVGVRRRGGTPAFAEFDAPKLPEETGEAPPADMIAMALGLMPGEVAFENHRAAVFSAGLAYTFVPVRGLNEIARIRTQPQHWADAFGEKGAVYAYCRETLHTHSSFHARMFWPSAGVSEDPATGSAAAAFAAVVHRFDGAPDGQTRLEIEQGFEMGRPSHITLELQVQGGALKGVRIGGHAVTVQSGTFTV
ncbi:MAG: PhzF family phenazine biosynthesis protein [Hyphomicrobiaceae bacterium]